MNAGDPFEEEEEEGEAEHSDDEESFAEESVFDVNEYYHHVLGELRRNQCSFLQLEDQGIFDLILENLDEFCSAISHSEGIKTVSFGATCSLDEPFDERLEMTTENATLWNMLLQTLGSISSLETIYVGVDSFSPSILTRLLQVARGVVKIDLFFPTWRAAAGEDLRAFANALSNHSCESISIDLSNLLGDFDEHHSAEPINRLGDHTVLSELLRLEVLESLDIEYSELSLEECRSFAGILTSDTCRIKKLKLYNCFFPDKKGESFVGKAVGRNQSLNEVHVWASFQGHSIHNTLVSCLTQTISIKEILLGKTTLTSHSDEVEVVELIKSVARGNTSIESVKFYGLQYELQQEQIQELRQHVEQNYTLKHLSFQDRQPFAQITRLNAAGRSYLGEDPHNNSKCIAVLAKAKDDLDCLYFHMRENPILCISYCCNTSNLSGNKRKADNPESSA